MKSLRDSMNLLRRRQAARTGTETSSFLEQATDMPPVDRKSSAARILVVEDDDAISFGLRTNLAFEGYEVQVARTRAEAATMAVALGPDLIVLDLMLPDGSGFEVMEDLGRAGYPGLILVLSARKEETDKVSALRMGADDYVTKPFSLAELLARVEALLRRQNGTTVAVRVPPAAGAGAATGEPLRDDGLGAQRASSVAAGASNERVRFGRCDLDLGARVLRVAEKAVPLTRLEFDLLVYLVQNAGRALTRSQLLRDVWGLPHDGSARTVDNVIAHLRTKIGEDAEHPRHLLTLRGAGYRFEFKPESPRQKTDD